MNIEVKKIIREPDRLLLYGSSTKYYIISKPDENVKVGDIIEYDPYGFNFGWFTRKA